MNKGELISELAEKGHTKKDAEKFLDDMLEVMEEAFVKGEDIRLVGFGSWSVRNRAAREAKNPRNLDEVIKIPATKTITFKPGKPLKEKINK